MNEKMKEFLIKYFGSEEGIKIFNLAEAKYVELLKNMKPKTKAQTKTLKRQIMPRVALYKVLQSEEKYKDNAQELVEKFCVEVIALKMQKSYLKIEKIPFFYNIFSSIMRNSIKNGGLNSGNIKKGKNEFFIDMKHCFWWDSCNEFGCPEICKYFCECDDVTYGNLNTLGMERTKTLGRGGDSCDFRFYKK